MPRPAHARRPAAPRGGPAGPAGAAGTPGREALYGVIDAVARATEPGRVLPAIVELVADATGADACLVLLREGDRLAVRAASPAPGAERAPGGLVEGLGGWVVRHDRPAFLREDAAADPRLARAAGPGDPPLGAAAGVPLRGRDGVLGAIVLGTVAPGALSADVPEFLEHVASLVVGAIERARLLDLELRSVDVLGRLAALVGRIATAADRAELMRATADGTLALLGADRCHVRLFDPADGTGRVVARAATPAGDERPEQPPVDAPERGQLAVRIAAGDAGEGLLSAERAAPYAPHERVVLETVAAQVAVALRTVELVERLTGETLVRELFDAIERGRGTQVAARARSARIDPERPHVVAVFAPLTPGAAWPAAARIESRLRHTLPGALCDAAADRVRVLLPVPAGDPAALARLDDELDRLAREEGAAAGRSSVQARLAAEPASLEEAASAARIARALAPAGGARAWDGLGAYRYLVGVGGELEPDARHARAVDLLWEYDARRGADLVRTLERYLAERSVVPTARALRIHPNTLRQRLERIEHLTALHVPDEDLVSLELAIKLHRLRAPERGAAA